MDNMAATSTCGQTEHGSVEFGVQNCHKIPAFVAHVLFWGEGIQLYIDETRHASQSRSGIEERLNFDDDAIMHGVE